MNKSIVIIAISLFYMAVSLQSCNEAASNMFVGVWEISSKDDVDEDGTSLEHILELKTDNVFTETYTYYKNDKVIAEVSVEGEYGAEKTNRINKYTKETDNLHSGYTLWRKYNIDSMNVEAADDDGKEMAKMLEKEFIKMNNELEDAQKKNMVYGLTNIKADLDLSWETDEPIDESFPDIMKRATAKRIIKETPME